MPNPTSITTDLIKPACALLERLYQAGKVYEKAGVVFNKLVPEVSIQSNLFVAASEPQKRVLMSKIDNINFSMRNEPVKLVSSGIKRPWKMKQELLSPRYTTRWAELLKVN